MQWDSQLNPHSPSKHNWWTAREPSSGRNPPPAQAALIAGANTARNQGFSERTFPPQARQSQRALWRNSVKEESPRRAGFTRVCAAAIISLASCGEEARPTGGGVKERRIHSPNCTTRSVQFVVRTRSTAGHDRSGAARYGGRRMNSPLLYVPLLRRGFPHTATPWLKPLAG